jgi:hypothetical protein
MRATTVYGGIAETLVKRGDHVDAIELRCEGQSSFQIVNGVHVYRIQTRVRDETTPFSYLRKMLMFLVRSMWTISVRHIQVKYDIVHVHSVPDFQVFSTIVPRMMGTKVILDIHDIVPEFYVSRFKISKRSIAFQLLLAVEQISAAYCNHVIISNHLWRCKLIKRSVRPEKCTVIKTIPICRFFSLASARPLATATSLSVTLEH